MIAGADRTKKPRKQKIHVIFFQVRRVLTSTTGRNSSHRAFDAGLSSTCLRRAGKVAEKANYGERQKNETLRTTPLDRALVS